MLKSQKVIFSCSGNGVVSKRVTQTERVNMSLINDSIDGQVWEAVCLKKRKVALKPKIAGCVGET